MSKDNHSDGEGGIPIAQEIKNHIQSMLMNTCCFHLYFGMNILFRK